MATEQRCSSCGAQYGHSPLCGVVRGFMSPTLDSTDPPALLPHIVKAVAQERAFQDRKHGSPIENPHSIGSWLLTIEAELLEAKAAAIKGGVGRDNVINEIIQIAALCVACLEQHGVEEVNGRQV